MSLLSCPSDINGFRNAPALALGVYREPGTGELQTGRWSFKRFTTNRKQASQCSNNKSMKHLTPTNVIDCLVQRNILIFWAICFFRCLPRSYIDISLISLHSQKILVNYIYIFANKKGGKIRPSNNFKINKTVSPQGWFSSCPGAFVLTCKKKIQV